MAKLVILLLSPGSSPAGDAFRLQTLDSHFLEYFVRYIEKPPLSILLDAALVKILGVQGFVGSPAPLFVTGLISVCAALFIYASARQFRAPAWPAAAVAFLFGLGIVPFDYWRAGAHYDHYTIGLAALFVYATSRFMVSLSWRSALLLGGAAMIYVLQSSIASAVTPVTITACGIALWGLGAASFREIAAKILVALAMPLLTVGAISAKNSVWSGVAVPASNGGAANMMMAWRVAGHASDMTILDRAIERIGAPRWYRWCWNHPGSFAGNLASDPHPGWNYIARTHGFCFDLTRPDAPAWPTDFEPLISYLRGDPTASVMLNRVEEQAAIARERRYLFTGYNPENALPWTAAYGAVSSRVLREVILSHSKFYLTAVRTNALLMWEEGPSGVSTMLRESRTLRAPSAVLRTVGWVVDLWEIACRLALLLCVLMVGVTALAAANGLARAALLGKPIPPRAAWSSLNLRATVALAIPGLAVVAVFVLVSTGEFGRLFIQASPALFATLAAVPALALKVHAPMRLFTVAAIERIGGMLNTSRKIIFARWLSRAVIFLRRLTGRGAEIAVRRSGVLWHVDLNEGIDFSIWLLGGFEPRTLKQYEELVKPGAIVIDVGANVGAHTLPFARLVGPSGRVLAVEPTQWAFAKLMRNLELNPELAGRVKPVQAMLVADREGALAQQIYSSWPLEPQDGLHEQHRGRLMSTTGATVITLDDAVTAASMKSVDFIKIDVDGGEFQVMKGALATLSTYRPRILIELAVYDPGQFAALLQLIGRCGYVPFHAITRKPLPLDPAEMIRHIPTGGSINALLEPA